MLRKRLFAISMLLALILVISISMAITTPTLKTVTSAVLTVAATQDANLTAQATDSALVVSPAITNSKQILAKHTDSALTIDVMAISPHTPADFGHVVASTQFDSALKKSLFAYTSQMGISLVNAVLPPILSGSSFSSISAVQQKMMRISMVAADYASPTAGSVVVISNCGQAGKNDKNIHLTRIVATPSFAIAMA